jgi:hypothetical protein
MNETNEMNDCPVCRPGTCRGYPHLWRQLARDREKWLPVHDQVNASADTVARPAVPEQDEAGVQLRQYVIGHSCGGC